MDTELTSLVRDDVFEGQDTDPALACKVTVMTYIDSSVIYHMAKQVRMKLIMSHRAHLRHN